MPTPRANQAAAVADDVRIFVFGGHDGSRSLGIVEAYDPGTNTWTNVTPMPTARSGSGAATGYDGKIYLIGGSQVSPGREVFVPVVEAYDQSDDTWRTLSPLPTGLYNLAAAVAIDGRIYAMGGFDEFYRYANAVEVYDPSNDRWTAAPSMHTGREGLGGARGTDDRIYAIGGLTLKDNYRLGVLTSVEAYTP